MIGFISDVHGNLAALQAVLERLDKLGVTEIVCLGDTAGYYSQVNECAELVRKHTVLALAGNHEWYLLGNPCERSVTANRCIEYQRSVVEPTHLEWFASLKTSGSYAGYSLVHGGWNDPRDEYLREPSVEYFAQVPGNRFASGHTHVPIQWSEAGLSYFNPGSVGQPRDGDARASFATVDDGRIDIHRVDYDIRATQNAMRAAGFDDYVAASLSYGLPIGGRR